MINHFLQTENYTIDHYGVIHKTKHGRVMQKDIDAVYAHYYEWCIDYCIEASPIDDVYQALKGGQL